MKKIPNHIGLALGSGAARGMAHIGVLKALQEKGIKPDFIAGTSMGAVVGAFYAKDGSIEDIESVVLGLNWAKLAGLIDPGFYFLREGLINGSRIIDTIHAVLGDVTFEELKVPFVCVATNFETGTERVFSKGKVIDAIRASISTPGLFAPVKFEGNYYIDGGVVNPLPISVVKKYFKGHVVAVDVSRDFQKVYRRKKESSPQETKSSFQHHYLSKINAKLEEFVQENKTFLNPLLESAEKIKNNIEKMKKRIIDRPPTAISVILKTMVLMEYQISQASLRDADIVIKPDVDDIDLLEFHRAEEAIDAGVKSIEAFRAS